MLSPFISGESDLTRALGTAYQLRNHYSSIESSDPVSAGKATMDCIPFCVCVSPPTSSLQPARQAGPCQCFILLRLTELARESEGAATRELKAKLIGLSTKKRAGLAPAHPQLIRFSTHLVTSRASSDTETEEAGERITS